jgi:mRNA-degrading endonuclease HigB of HigAB toxin-antitoxin module
LNLPGRPGPTGTKRISLEKIRCRSKRRVGNCAQRYAHDFRLVARIQYQAGVFAIRFFGCHAEYDKIDAEIV